MLDIQLHIEKIKAAGITYPADLARMIEVCQEIQEDKRMDKFEAEIRAAKAEGYNYAEVSESGEHIHFCYIPEGRNSTPLDWSWGPYATSFWLD